MKESVYDFLYAQELHHWWYRVRRTLVKKLVKQYARERKETLQILDIGCGAGALMQELEEFGEVTGIDISERAVEACRKRGLSRVIHGDAAQLPFPNDSFDVVVMMDVLEHLKDDAVGSREVARVLKKDGLAIVAVPAFMFLWGITDIASHHYRRYRRAELVERLIAAGLHVQYSGYFNTFLFPLIAMIRVGVRLLHIPVKSEHQAAGKIANALCYGIFALEPHFIPMFRFPCGVSALALARKP